MLTVQLSHMASLLQQHIEGRDSMAYEQQWAYNLIWNLPFKNT